MCSRLVDANGRADTDQREVMAVAHLLKQAEVAAGLLLDSRREVRRRERQPIGRGFGRYGDDGGRSVAVYGQ